jgi:MFS family permease
MNSNSPKRTSASAPDTSAPIYTDGTLWLLFAVTMVAVGNVSSVSPAFPRMVDALGITRSEVAWVVTAYSLPGVLSAPLAGILADRLGRKRVLVPSLIVFSLAGSACAGVRNFDLLLALRAVQGTTAAPLVALSVTLIGDLYEGPRRAAAIGYNTTALNLSTAGYPAVGGALAGVAWHWPFALPLLALPVGLAVAWKLAAPPVDGSASLADYLGTAGRYLADRRVFGLLLVEFSTFVLLFGAFLTYVPELMDVRFEAVALTSGLVLAVSSLTSGLVATQVGPLSRRMALRHLIQAALVLDALALAGFALADTMWAAAVASAVFGVAQGISRPALQTRITEIVPADARGAILSLNGTVLRLGQAVGPVLAGVVLVRVGVGGVFWAASAGALLVLVLAIALLRD